MKITTLDGKAWRHLAHDMVNILGRIRNASELLNDPSTLTADEATMAINMMNNDLTQAESLIRNVCLLQRYTLEPATDMAPTPVAETAQAAWTAASAGHPGHTFENAGVENAQAKADASRLEDALREIFQNACRYSPPNSTITLEAKPADGQLTLTVRNPAPAPSPENLQRMGTPFFRTPEATELAPGHGLGLAKAMAAVHSMGGQMEISATEGQFHVHIHLPIS